MWRNLFLEVQLSALSGYIFYYLCTKHARQLHLMGLLPLKLTKSISEVRVRRVFGTFSVSDFGLLSLQRFILFSLKQKQVDFHPLHLALHSLGCCNGSSFCDEAKLGS
jgi:hypothetical protein